MGNKWVTLGNKKVTKVTVDVTKLLPGFEYKNQVFKYRGNKGNNKKVTCTWI